MALRPFVLSLLAFAFATIPTLPLIGCARGVAPPTVPTETVDALAQRLGDLFEERQAAISGALNLFEASGRVHRAPVWEPGFVPSACLLEDLGPFLDAFQRLVRHSDYSLDELMARPGTEPSEEARPGRMRFVAIAVRLMRLRVIDQSLREEFEEASRSAADCFRASRTSPSSPALCLWYCSAVSSDAMPPRTAEEYLRLEEFRDGLRPEIEKKWESVGECERRIAEILAIRAYEKSDPSMTGSPEENADLAWLQSGYYVRSLSPEELAYRLQDNLEELGGMLYDFRTSDP